LGNDTPEKVIDTWKWFSSKIEESDDYWDALEGETLYDFLQHNWSPFSTDFRESLIVDIISLMLDLRMLESAKIDASSKLSEIRDEKIKGNVKAFEELSANAKFHTSAKMVRLAFLNIRKIRRELNNLSSETTLARFAKENGFQIILSKSPDLFINKKRVEVKRPKVLYINPRKQASMHEGLLILNEDNSIIENLSKHIERGFDQKADIVAIDVNHLERRQINGFKAKWLTPIMSLENALQDALSFEKKGIVLLFKCRRDGYQGVVLRCKKL
jgi:hypothetical protein